MRRPATALMPKTLRLFRRYRTGDTLDVGSRLPNALGLYDMSGNVSELCWDWDELKHGTAPVTDPTGPLEGEIPPVTQLSTSTDPCRIDRGGDFNPAFLQDLRINTIYHYSRMPDDYSWMSGFRVVHR